MHVYDTIYVGGSWVAPSSTATSTVVNPATEQPVATVPSCGRADVDRAVAAAREAFDAWSHTTPAERAELLRRLAAELDARKEEAARTISAEMGAPLKIATSIQVGLPLAVLRTYIELLADVEFTEQVANSLVVKEPVGVVAAITPWNYPLHQAMAKVAAALAAGCTIVLKPAQLTPLSAYLLAEAVDKAGFPAGVFNLVPGSGAEVGEALALHPEVDMVSFTGSTGAGRRVSELAAGTIKRVALELGGKSANVILPDADLGQAVKAGVANAFLNSGQTCTAWTRMLVHADQYDKAVELARQVTEGYAVGDPHADGTVLGPLTSARQRETVLGYIRAGIEEGAVLVTGGVEPPEGLGQGYYVRPTVFAGVEPGMTIAQEEIFGPVLTILRYRDEEEALRIANDSVYGLSGAVWSADEERAAAFARRMQTGQVHVNGGRFNPMAPFGGYKQSGNGRELGRHGLEEFLETKSIQL